MKLIAFIFSAFFAVTTAAQTTQINDANATPRKVENFHSVSVSNGITLYLSQGSEQSVAVSATEAKDLERLKTTVQDGVLKIHFDAEGINWKGNSKRKLTAYVSATTLQKLTASGGAMVIATSTITGTDMEVRVTSGAILTAKVTATNLEIEQNSGSQVNVSGSAGKLKVEATSGALFNGYDLTTDFCTAKATSGGAIRITIQKELDASANSGGAIRYKGAALIRDVNVNSGGIVKKA